MEHPSISISPTSSYEDGSEQSELSSDKDNESEIIRVIASRDESISLQERHDRIINFIQVPTHVEPFISFGFLICLDTLLFYLVTLPFELCIYMMHYIYTMFLYIIKRPYKNDINKNAIISRISLLIVSLILLVIILDPSRLYHSIRGQSIIKLYVIYNVCEVADKLCCSFGLDLVISFLETNHRNNNHLAPWFHFLLCILYILVHTCVYFYQFETLNVAIHSDNHALLTLLLSCQFVEIKSSVFKKFERENLFQLSCNEMVERLLLFVFCILSFLSTSYDVTILPSLSVIIISEVFADWIKHAFITKFNVISCKIYLAFMDIISRDYSRMISNANEFKMHSEKMSTQIGFSPLPLVCMIFRIMFHIFITKCKASSLLEILQDLFINFVYCWTIMFIIQQMVNRILGWITRISNSNK